MSTAKRARVERSGSDGAVDAPLEYMPGFGNDFSSESIAGALPSTQNSPQKCPMGLYAEQLSGTAFTAPRSHGSGNQRSWLYKIHPSVMHSRFERHPNAKLVSHFSGSDTHIDPNQFRWPPLAIPAGADAPVNFVQGLVTMSGAGDTDAHHGLAVHLYACNSSMSVERSCFCNADGDFLIVPQTGALVVTTEFGVMRVDPCEICVVQRGMKFAVDVPDGAARGYVLEVFTGHFVLPDLGPIGANGLANPRDFLTPVARFFDEDDAEHVFFNKFGGQMWRATIPHNPFDVVAWHGNYAPYKYDLRRFMTMNSVNYDHPDPSVYTVLSCLSDTPGVAIADFVIFPPRWMVMEHTFRPPYYHRNIMSEFMGQIWGAYDAKVGFVPGASSLHSCMTPHGPDAKTFEGASNAELTPEFFDKGLAFMFETCLTMRLTSHAMETADRDYPKCWDGLRKHFDPTVLEAPPADGTSGIATKGAASAIRALEKQAAALAATVAAGR